MGMLSLGSAFFVCLFVIIYTSDETLPNLAKLQTPLPKGKGKYKKRAPMSHQRDSIQRSKHKRPTKECNGGTHQRGKKIAT
jgi:hypothetical protein